MHERCFLKLVHNISIYELRNTKTMGYTEITQIRLTRQQKETLKKLEKFKINVSKFIRDAISEKIKRDYIKIKEQKDNWECPF